MAKYSRAVQLELLIKNDNHSNCQKSVDNFEIAHKACSISVWGAVPP